MSTDSAQQSKSRIPVDPLLSISELTAVLVKHYDLHDGLYDLMLEYKVGTGPVRPDKDKKNVIPGAIIGVSRIGITRAEVNGPTTVDAAEINPLKNKRRS